jgi:hypothetical protein
VVTPILVSETPAFQSAREAIARVRRAGAEYAHAIGQEAALVREKPGRKLDAVLRIMQGENRLTSKPHSATSAEAVVELDAEYREFCRQLTAATCQRELARTDVIAARLEAQLALALVLDQDEL